jgi:hypothetical protein
VRRLDNGTKCGEYGCRILTKLRHARLLVRIVKRQCGEPTDVSVNGALSLTERAVRSRTGGAPLCTAVSASTIVASTLSIPVSTSCV